MDDCIFCKIVRGEIPCYKIYEDEKFLAFLDISQFTKGHTLVIPKTHYRFIWDVEDMEGYANTVKKLCIHFTQKLGFQYVDTLSMGRMVPHAHIHLVPHNNNENDWEKALSTIGDLQDDVERRLTQEQGKEIAEKFTLTD
ncbi:hypothetical protein A3J98_02670 [candidate division WS6 bacterium RIFOXYC1_FULL_33_10]|uniref:HIT domain-containing protein n=1 Tax=candidate division WS6 bacterium RIFOXYC1_FULL_33_10 TaxID=1802606 RepID=A0A1F4UNV8_9BACT|nr:MAG: hypothetical protein A3J98_02670 [candidate division WS6 bacterium RIFOXYC1_FULL_33_10]